jgi:hypothetical protein
MVAVRSGTFYGKRMIAGRMYTIAGTGVSGYAGDGGPARRALLRLPRWLAIGRAGNVLIGDWGNGTVRSVSG